MKKILLIEDDPVSVYIARVVIQTNAESAEIQDFASGEEAIGYLAACGHSVPDIILVDMKLRGIDGHQFLAWYQSHVLRRSAHTRVFVLSSAVRNLYRNLLVEYPFVSAYFEKPLTPQVLRAILNWKE